MGLGTTLSKLRHKGYITEAEYLQLKDAKKSKDRIEGLEGACRQFMWERDVAISQLKDLGYSFGEKTEPVVPQIRKEIDDLGVLISSTGLSVINKCEVIAILDKYNKG